ncbi:hypothetical protein PG988_013551 [Apiospora saccharicola]
MATQSTRKRRTRNELVWTQPRTIPPGMHSTVGPMNGTDAVQSEKTSSPLQQQQAKKQSDQPNKEKSDGAAAEQSSMLLSQSTHPWGSGPFMADLDPNSIMSDAFPSPGQQHSHCDFQFMSTPDRELVSTMSLHDMEGLTTTAGEDAASTATCLDFENLLSSYQSQNQNQNSPPHSLPKRKSKNRHTSTASSDTTLAVPEFAHSLEGRGALDLDLDLDADDQDGVLARAAFRGYNAAHLAAHQGRHSMVRLLLLTCPDRRLLANAVNDDGQTPLHVAAAQGHVEVVRELLCLGADSHLQDHEGQNPLHAAVAAGSAATVQLLLDQDVDHKLAHTADAGGHTPLHRAVIEGTEEIVRVLLNRGADPGATIR